jgi:hypothetical protein
MFTSVRSAIRETDASNIGRQGLRLRTNARGVTTGTYITQ